MARLLEIEWRETDLPVSEKAGYGTTYLPLSALSEIAGGSIQWASGTTAEKPIFVYFYAGDDETDRLQKTEKSMFGNDNLAIATKFFRCMRIDVDQIEDQKIRKQFAPKTPAFYFLDDKGQQLAKKIGKLSSRAIVANLAKVYKATYGANLTKRIKNFNKFLDRLEKASDKAAQVSAKLSDLEERISKRDTPRNRKKLEALKAEHTSVVEAEAKLEEEKSELLAPPQKAKKTVAKR